MRIAFALLSMVIGASAAVMAENGGKTLDLALPTDNTALFSGGGPAFYQYIVRDYKGVKSTPWQGGQYGFVRDPQETVAGRIFTRFHEGIDIRPVHRDAKGEPLDHVRAIAAGQVVYVNLVPGYSNYGKYVVIEHVWGGSNYYSLYGHLAAVSVSMGTSLRRGDTLGVMGYTGEGLDRARAHVHLELNLLLSRQFDAWHSANFRNEQNHHGIYNGINLAGIDIAALYLALRKQPSLTIPQFLARESVAYKVIVPAAKNFDLPRQYPWMLRSGSVANANSWEVSFNNSGLPLKVVPSEKSISVAELSYFKKSPVNYSYITRGVLGGSGNHTFLTESGRRLMELLTFPD